MYGGDISRGFVGSICQRNICKTWGTSKDYIELRPKICVSILGSIYSKTRDMNSDVNGILSINRWTNRMAEPDIGVVFKALCKSYTE